MSDTDVVITLIQDATVVPSADPDDVIATPLQDEVLGATLLLGETGGDGPPGGEGPGEVPGNSLAHFIFTQASPSALWTIAHNLDRRPLIQVFSAGGVEVEAEIIHTSANVAQIAFAWPFAGQAVCL